MARNAIESDFRSSKMAAGGHFAIESDFRSSKMAAGDNFVKTFKTKIVYWSESHFQSSKMATSLLVRWKPFIEMLVH